MKRILVCGGRDFGTDRNERYWICSKLDEFLNVSEDNMLGDHCVIITGMAKGVDRVAYDYGISSWKEVLEYPANWDEYGRRAGILRNIQMLEEGKPDVVLAFPGGRGTEHMKHIAREAGVEVIEFELAQ